MSMAAQEAGSITKMEDLWKDSAIADKYARAEAGTRPYADIFMRTTNIATVSSPIHALDLACGTGAVTAALHAAVPKEKWVNVHVLGGDISEPMLAYLKSRAEREGWPNVRTAPVNAADMKFPKESFTHIFANAIVFVLPTSVLKSCFGVLRPGGSIAVSTWASLPWWRLVEKAVAALPSPPPLPAFEDVRSRLQMGNAWHEPSFVKAQLEEAGFANVEIVQEKFTAGVGTPAQFMEMMTLPIQTMVAPSWEEGKRERYIGEVMGEMRKLAVEEAGGEEGIVMSEMDGIVGVGWKRA